jgi:ABC-2 type transport system ATP-binding protein
MNTSRSNRPPSRSGRPPSQRTRNRTGSASSSGKPSDNTSGKASGTRPGDGERPASKPAPAKVERTGPPPAVETVGLAKAYGDAPALWPLDLCIEIGERVSLIGHNGSGKTTLMRMLVGMLEPSEGTATIAGHPIGSIEARAAVSYLADQPVFYDDLTVWEHLEYIARLHGTDDWEQQAVDLVDMVGLMERVDDLPMTFSRGLKQKAALTMAFVRPFDVMLIDEPFVGLDRLGREALLELLKRAHADGATLVVATHELSSVQESGRLIALSNGQLTFNGEPADADLAALTEGAHPAAPPEPD